MTGQSSLIPSHPEAVRRALADHLRAKGVSAGRGRAAMTNDLYDVWTARDEPRLRVVVRHGDGMPPYYASTDMRRLGSARVADDIAADVLARGHYAMSTNIPFDPKAILGDPLASDRDRSGSAP